MFKLTKIYVSTETSLCLMGLRLAPQNTEHSFSSHIENNIEKTKQDAENSSHD